MNFEYRFYLHNPNMYLSGFLAVHRNSGGNSLSMWRELPDIKKKKVELEFQLRSMEEKERILEERAKMLEEKLEIQELEERLKVKHEVVEQLESKVRDLEKRLKEPQEEPEASRITNEPSAKSSPFKYVFNTR